MIYYRLFSVECLLLTLSIFVHHSISASVFLHLMFFTRTQRGRSSEESGTEACDFCRSYILSLSIFLLRTFKFLLIPANWLNFFSFLCQNQSHLLYCSNSQEWDTILSKFCWLIIFVVLSILIQLWTQQCVKLSLDRKAPVTGWPMQRFRDKRMRRVYAKRMEEFWLP